MRIYFKPDTGLNTNTDEKNILPIQSRHPATQG